MSALFRLLITLVLPFLLINCGGQVVTERLTVSPTQLDPSQCAVKKTVAILPLADYTFHDDDEEVAFKRNMLITEALIDQFVSKGFRLPVYEDMVQYLMDNEIINSSNTSSSSSSQVSSLENELRAGAWSADMKNEIKKQIRLQKKGQNKTLKGLDNRTLSLIGRTFKADYILRGRILKYTTEEANTWNPFKKGFFPVFFGLQDRIMFGYADSELYDNVNTMAVGAGLGAAVGNSLETPYSPATSDYSNLNSLTWGAIGAGAAYLSKQAGDTTQAVVHLRVWVQDASTGEVIWTNKAEVEVTPRSIYADRNKERLFHTAVNQAVSALIDDFWMKAELVM